MRDGDEAIEPLAEAENAISIVEFEISAVAVLLSLAKTTRASVDLLLGEIQLSVGQDSFLDRLDPAIPAAVSKIAGELNVRPSTVSKMLERLSERGLVERRQDESDARRTTVVLTTAGEAKREEVRAVWERLETEIFRSQEIGDIQKMKAALRTIDDVLKRRLSRLR